MAGRHRQKGYPVRVISEHLEDMAAGYDPVELPPKIELQRIRLDPDHLVLRIMGFGDLQHRLGWLDAHDLMPLHGEGAGQQSCSATEIEDAMQPGRKRRENSHYLRSAD